MASKHEEELQRLMEKNHVEQTKLAIEADKNRAHTVSVGHSGGGSIEIMMRGYGGSYLFNVYQPVEVIELINQLSACIGCHIHIQPRNDFSSWREWNISDDEIERLGEHPPFADYNSNLTESGKGVSSIRQKKQAIQHLSQVEDKLLADMTEKLKITLLEELNVKEDVAANTTVRRKSSKRSSTPSE
jgi:hypothetical protein